MKLSKKAYAEILKKNDQLEDVRVKLKQEFMAIDDQIDQVVNSCQCWFITPQFQQKPVIINLWGMTGVGKTSLIKRFVELIGFDDQSITLDAGLVQSSSWELEDQLTEFEAKRKSDAVVIIFDEFQHAKIINEKNEEIDKHRTRLMWEIIDTGKYVFSTSKAKAWELKNAISKLELLLIAGVKVQKGIITSGIGLTKSFLEENELERNGYHVEPKKERKSRFLLPRHLQIIKILFPSTFINVEAVIKVIDQLNGEETIKYLKQLLEKAFKPKVIDCSKSLIFVMGNLDEAYSLSHSLETDISADTFNELTKKVNVKKIKEALQRRFRVEQIARLGNNHVIYPTFNNEGFTKLIDLSLGKVSTSFFNQTNIKLSFDANIKQLIYNEGVYPTLGTRPLLSTISNIVENRLPKLIFIKLRFGIVCDSIEMSFHDEEISIKYRHHAKLIHVAKDKIDLFLEKERKPLKNNRQAIVAVHESGHAVIYISLFRKIPIQIVTVTSDADSQGFMQVLDSTILTHENIRHEIATYLGGYWAEEMIFGREHITNGSEVDLKKATQKASRLVKSLGMGERLATYHIPDFNSNHLLPADKSCHLEIQQIMDESKQLVKQILEKERTLLLRLADHLSEHRRLGEEEIKEFVVKYAESQLLREQIDCSDDFHLAQLKLAVNQIDQLKLASA